MLASKICEIYHVSKISATYGIGAISAELLGYDEDFADKFVFVKMSYNSAEMAPASSAEISQEGKR